MCRKRGQQLSNFYPEDDSISQKSVTRDSDSEKSETRVDEIRPATTSTRTSADSPKDPERSFWCIKNKRQKQKDFQGVMKYLWGLRIAWSCTFWKRPVASGTTKMISNNDRIFDLYQLAPIFQTWQILGTPTHHVIQRYIFQSHVLPKHGMLAHFAPFVANSGQATQFNRIQVLKYKKQTSSPPSVPYAS